MKVFHQTNQLKLYSLIVLLLSNIGIKAETNNKWENYFNKYKVSDKYIIKSKTEKTSKVNEHKKEMIFYNYKKKSTSIVKQNTSTKPDPKLPESIQKVINRELLSKKRIKLNPNNKKAQNYIVNTTREKGVILKVVGVNTNQKNYSYINNFSFLPSFDEYSPLNSKGHEDIVISENKLRSRSLLRGAIVSRKYVRTNFILPLGDKQYFKLNPEIEIPLLSLSFIDNFIEKNNNRGRGGLLLFEAHYSVNDIAIDINYETKYFLDNKFKQVKKGTAFKFVFFTGVSPGNTVVSYLVNTDQTAQKIIYIDENELFFDKEHFEPEKRIELDLYERKILSRYKTDLRVSPKDIKVFNRKIYSKTNGINRYEVRYPPRPITSRNYFELGHLNKPIFLGVKNNYRVELPSKGYLGKVLNIFNIDALDEMAGQCLVHINLTKELKEIKVNGIGRSGHIGTDIFYLDKDGVISTEISRLTEKIFIRGDLEGMLNIKFKYLNGSEEYLKTICAWSVYLVEQL